MTVDNVPGYTFGAHCIINCLTEHSEEYKDPDP